MKMIMKAMMLMMKIIPRFIRKKMPAMILKKKRKKAGKHHPTIKLNLENLLICGKYCGTCPSKPNKQREALYCATGTSEIAEIQENGCNCVSCPLYDLCSSENTAYFCKNGACSQREETTDEHKFLSESDKYIERFMADTEEERETEKKLYSNEISDDLNKHIIDVKIDFIGDKIVQTQSNIPLLKASLSSGIQHTHVCGGRARCSTCRVVITDGLENCIPRNEKETLLAQKKGFSPEIRLACQTTIKGDIQARRLVLDNDDISRAINQGREGAGEVGREVQAAILFSDIRSFTSFSENSFPYDVIHILNRYFETIGKKIDENGGYIDKYMGDGIMAIFGLDKNYKEHPAILAANAAFGMLESLNAFNDYLKKHFKHNFKIGIGVHTGNVIIGTLGYHMKKEYTALGDTVNTASRIETLNKRTGTCILFSESTYNAVKHKFSFSKKYTTKVKGKQDPITVYEPKLKDGLCCPASENDKIENANIK